MSTPADTTHAPTPGEPRLVDVAGRRQALAVLQAAARSHNSDVEDSFTRQHRPRWS